MTDYPKYLIVMSEHDCECVIVFNPILSHREVAGRMEVVSAGHCRLPDKLNHQVSAWGESTTLNIKSRGQEDANAILHYLCRPQEE